MNSICVSFHACFHITKIMNLISKFIPTASFFTGFVTEGLWDMLTNDGESRR